MSIEWTTEDYLDNPFLMAHLQYLAEYQKESLLGMIEAETILPHLRRMAKTIADVWNRYSNNPMAQQEMTMSAATGDGDQSDPSEWTQAEIDRVQKWWEKTFPGETNPLFL